MGVVDQDSTTIEEVQDAAPVDSVDGKTGAVNLDGERQAQAIEWGMI